MILLCEHARRFDDVTNLVLHGSRFSSQTHSRDEEETIEDKAGPFVIAQKYGVILCHLVGVFPSLSLLFSFKNELLRFCLIGTLR